MTALEFIKKFGWGEVIKAIENLKPYEEYISGIYNHEPVKVNNGFFINRTLYRASVVDLKQFVDAWELVGVHGLEQSKTIVKNAPSDDHFYSWVLGGSGVKDKTVNIGDLRKAITLVKKVNATN